MTHGLDTIALRIMSSKVPVDKVPSCTFPEKVADSENFFQQTRVTRMLNSHDHQNFVKVRNKEKSRYILEQYLGRTQDEVQQCEKPCKNF